MIIWQENLKILGDVLDRLHKYNLYLKLPKWEFLKPEVVYLGLRISTEGLQPVEEKINQSNGAAERAVRVVKEALLSNRF